MITVGMAAFVRLLDGDPYANRDERLTDLVLRNGWDGGLRKRFLSRYGLLIRRSILYHIRRHFGGAQMQILAEYLTGLEKGGHSEMQGEIGWRMLDVAANTWQDVWTDIFRTEGGLVAKWAEYKEAQKGRGEESRDFETYLKGAVQIRFQSNLRRHRKASMESTLDMEEAQEWLEDKQSFSDEGPSIPLVDETFYYWDGLIRCHLPAPDEIARELVQVKREASTVLVWGCAQLKAQLREKGQTKKLENLKAFMAFYCSQIGPRREEASPVVLSPDELNLEQVAGRYLRWKEDICQRIFKKRIRKDRIMEQIRKVILSSPYRNMLDGARSGGSDDEGF